MNTNTGNEETGQAPKKRPGADPVTSYKRALRIAYIAGWRVVNEDQGSTGRILETALLYSERWVACSACHGEKVIEPTPERLTEWGNRHELLSVLMGKNAFLSKFPMPESRKCGRCKGTGYTKRTVNAVTAQPTGSSLYAESSPVNLAMVVLVAKASRISQWVRERNPIHDLVLRTFYGDDKVLDSLAAAHGRLVALYPFTETGTRLIEAAGDTGDPWSYLAEYRKGVSDVDEVRRNDAAMAVEAQMLLNEATDTWNEGVEVVYPGWNNQPKEVE